jgi:tetratricopeptide (TPR) repeat protein
LEDYFQGRNDEHIRRIHIFTDRQSEQDVLLGRLKTAIDKRYSIADLTDYRRPARNLTVIYGEGGIGKSALIRSVAEKLAAERPKGKTCIIYIDLGDFTNHNFETVLMRLRGSLAMIGRNWPAFDLVLAHYWATKHPGVNLMRFIDHAGFLTTEQRAEVAQQVSSVLDGILGGMGLLGAGYRLVSTLRSKISESLITKELMRTYPPFGLLINDNDPEIAIGYLAAVLAYDWERTREQSKVQALCLIDTVEYVQDARPEKGSLEDLLARLIYLMPNMPFLAASRVRFNWADETRVATLTFGGAGRWPDLAKSNAGQIQLLGLDNGFSEQLLMNSLQVDGQPAMPPAVRQRIARGSYGLPLYLELSVNWYRDLLLSGNTPDPTELGKPFPELVLRIMRDLTSEERDLIRAASITEVFNSELLAAIVTDTRGSTIQRFLERSFVHYSPGSWLSYSMHKSLCNAILTHDHFIRDSWTPDEWRVRARRAVTWLEAAALQIWDSQSEIEIDRDEYGRRSVAALLLVATVAFEHDLIPGRLGDLAFTINQLGYRRAFESLPVLTSKASSFARLLSVAHTIAGNLDNSQQIYQMIRPELVANPQDSCDRFVATEFARAAQEVGKYEEASSAYASLVAGGGEMAHYAALGRAGIALRSGMLATALTYAGAVMVSHPIHGAASLDLRGHIYLAGGEHSRAAACFEESLMKGKIAGSPLWIARAMRHVAHAKMWFDPEAVLSIISEATELNESLGEIVGVAQCEMAKAMAYAWIGDLDKAEKFLSLSQGHQVDPISIGHPWLVETLLRKAQGDDAGAAAAALRVLSGTLKDAARPHIWYAVTALWAEREDLADFDAVEWYDSAQAARERWLEPLRRMRSVLSATPNQ